MTIRIGLVSIGKIARDQHIPAIQGSPKFTLAAAASRHASIDGVPNFATIEEMLASAEVDAVALCMPPLQRHAAARAALGAGKHVLLEKPPGATLSEVEDLRGVAEAKRLTLLATWHSRYAPAVEPAAAWLASRTVKRARIDWKEDVRHWHPGQDWVWAAGGFGVFDPGVNALSIATRLLPAFFLTRGVLSIPANRQTPIAADLSFQTGEGAPIEVAFDWRQTGTQIWEIEVETDGGTLLLSKGGDEMAIDGKPVACPTEAEYPALYARFAELIETRAIDVDTSPLRHVADAFLLGERKGVEAFED